MSEQDTTSKQSLPVDDSEPNIKPEATNLEEAPVAEGDVQFDVSPDASPAVTATVTGASEPVAAATGAATAAGAGAAAAGGLSAGAIIGMVVAIVAVVGIIAGVLFFNPTSSPEVAGVQKQLGIDPNAGDYKEPEKEESTGIAIPGWGQLKIPAGQTTVSVNFNNPEANADKYYLSFELRLKEGNELLYASALVPPGKTIQTITLSRALDAGEYSAIIHVQPYKMDEKQSKTNNADMETVLIVE